MLALKSWKRWICIGIRREEKSLWESRAPLTPKHVFELGKGWNVKFKVQPSNTRAFTGSEYERAGAQIDESLDECDIILGVKEIPAKKILPNKTYFCFSHTHKGQTYNMPILRYHVDRKTKLIDYELLTDEKGKRLVAFGKFAGYAGMINCLHGLGLQFLNRGYRTPFLNIALSHVYPSLDVATQNLKIVGEMIRSNGLPKDISPLLIIFTGNGNVSRGAQEIVKNLPVKFINPDQVRSLKEFAQQNELYACVLEAKDYCVRKDGGNFQYEEYLSHPTLYHSRFYDDFAPHCTALVNGIYWDNQFPRLLNMEQTQNLTSRNDKKLLTIADISCDISGSIECTTKATTIDEPFLYLGKEDKRLQIMSVDNLPAQLPKDSSEYFGNNLLPILSMMLSNISSNRETEIIKRATITENGVLLPKHNWLNLNISKAKSKSVLILGSGYVAGPVVQYLGLRDDINLIIGSDKLSEANALVKLSKRGADVANVDVKNQGMLERLIDQADIVISLVPATMHFPIAKICLEKGKNLVTASYISPEMQTLNEACVSKNLLFLNEIGLDPGLDHLSAKHIIDNAKQAGKRVVSFTSWCGGLPAPECANNPLGYKFSWSPRGVLLASQNNAKYLLNGKEIQINGKDLLSSSFASPFDSRLNLEGLANRDSLKYIPMYGIEGVETMLRGTLRYRGFSDIMKLFQSYGLLNIDPISSEKYGSKMSWSQIVPAPVTLRESEVHQWFDFNNEEFHNCPTLLDSFCELLQKKLKYSISERDMVILQHEFVLEGAEGREKVSSSLIEFGDKDGFSAMARTVGYPVAIATELILDGKIKLKGVQAPLAKEIYDPMLSRLESVAGIKFQETQSFITRGDLQPNAIQAGKGGGQD